MKSAVLVAGPLLAIALFLVSMPQDLFVGAAKRLQTYDSFAPEADLPQVSF
jgi:hypothetical protein